MMKRLHALKEDSSPRPSRAITPGGGVNTTCQHSRPNQGLCAAWYLAPMTRRWATLSLVLLVAGRARAAEPPAADAPVVPVPTAPVVPVPTAPVVPAPELASPQPSVPVAPSPLVAETPGLVSLSR